MVVVVEVCMGFMLMIIVIEVDIDEFGYVNNVVWV